MSRRRQVLLLCSAVALVACDGRLVGGGLLPDSGPEQDAGETGYPPGPYGAEVGDTVRNLKFAGYVNEVPSDGLVSDSGYEEGVTLERFRDLGYRYMLFNVAALWCVACQVEATVLPHEYEIWAELGGVVISVLIEDTSFNPAARVHLDSWVGAYSMNYTMLHDPGFEVANVFAPQSLPLNVMIDLESMKIIRLSVIDDPELFDFFESQLRQGN